MYDSTGLEILPASECLRLLGKTPVARLVFTEATLPTVQPVAFQVDGDSLIVETTAGSGVAESVHDSVVAVEADDLCLASGLLGWSVTVVGCAELVTDPEQVDRFTAAQRHPLGGQESPEFVRIPLTMIDGRRSFVGSAED